MPKDDNDFESTLNLINEIKKLKDENKEIKQILEFLVKNLVKHNLINPNSVELGQFQMQGGQDYEPNAQSGIFAGFGGGISPATKLQFNALNSKQNSSSNGRDNGRNSPLQTLLALNDSQEQKNGRSSEYIGTIDMGESKSTAESKQGKAESEESTAEAEEFKEFTRIYRKQIKLNADELKRFEKAYEDFKNDNKDNLAKAEHILNQELLKQIQFFKTKISSSTAKDKTLAEASTKIKEQIFIIEKLGCKISLDNDIGIKKLLIQGKAFTR